MNEIPERSPPTSDQNRQIRIKSGTSFDQFRQIRYLFRLAHLTKWGRKRPKSALALLKTVVPNFENAEKARTNQLRQIIRNMALRKTGTYGTPTQPVRAEHAPYTLAGTRGMNALQPAGPSGTMPD